jgi:hypothetical protein
MFAAAVLVYMTIGAFLALRAAIRVSGDLWRERIAPRRGVPLASAAWVIGLGAAHVVTQLWADGLALPAVSAG